MKKIIYTAGCLGFIGSHFTRKCLEKGWFVHGIDKLTYAANENALDEFWQHPNFQSHEKDIKDIKYLEDCDFIVNFAASSHVENSITNSDEFLNSNVLGVKNLLDIIKDKHSNSSDIPIVYHISTDEVYGDIKSATDKKFTEKSILCPSSPYSASKAAADLLILAWARTYGIKYNIIRPTNTYGTYQFPEKLIPLSVKNLMRGNKIRLHDNGTPIRTWLHVDDLCSAIFTIIEKGKLNEIYNVSGNLEQRNSVTVKKIIEAYFGTDENWEQYVDFGHIRLGQDRHYAVLDKKLKKLGWQPRKDFDKEIKKIVGFYKHNMIW